MKHSLLYALFSLMALMCFSQVKPDSSAHLSFKGVPLDGTLEQYVIKMKSAGFTHKGTADGTAMLEGDFAGYKQCVVVVSTLKQKNLVHKIGVFFPAKETWSTLSGNYFNLKELLTEKYGTPSTEVEKFDTRTEPRDDEGRMHQVQFDNCKYYCTWQTDKGEIRLSIEHESLISCFVRLVYLDKINSASIRKQAIDDL